MRLRLMQFALGGLERLSEMLPWSRRRLPEHLKVGRRGEDAAYFWLRRHGYTVVARNWRSPHGHGEVDLVGWSEQVLCFVEVKTRSRRAFVPAEAAVDREKQRNLQAAADDYYRRLGRRCECRFDVVSVYVEPGQAMSVELIKDAFEYRKPPLEGELV